MNWKKILSRNLRGKIMDALIFLPDRPYIKLFYYATIGRLPDLKHPKGYNEKLQWLKLYDRHPEYGPLVDKLAVKDYINQTLGPGYCFKTLGVWESFDEIDFDALPNRFVLKCNHDSGSVKIIHDKSSLTEADYKELRKFFRYRLKYDFFYAGREYPYKDVPRRIMAEEYMEDAEHPEQGVSDYKFYCFDGVPKLLLIVSSRESDKRKNFFDMDFHPLEISHGAARPGKVEKPACFEELKALAATLSTGMKHVRLDFYVINGRIYFGEYTFFPGGGFELFKPEEWERRLGDWIPLD